MLRGLQMEIPFWARMEATQNLRSIWISPTFPIICSNYVLHQNQQLLNPTKKKQAKPPQKKETATTEPLKKKMTGKKTKKHGFQTELWKKTSSSVTFSIIFPICLQDWGGDRPTWSQRDWFFLWIRMVIHSWYNEGIYDSGVTWEWLMVVHERIQDTQNNSYGPILAYNVSITFTTRHQIYVSFCCYLFGAGGNWVSDFWVHRNRCWASSSTSTPFVPSVI